MNSSSYFFTWKSLFTPGFMLSWASSSGEIKPTYKQWIRTAQFWSWMPLEFSPLLYFITISDSLLLITHFLYWISHCAQVHQIGIGIYWLPRLGKVLNSSLKCLHLTELLQKKCKKRVFQTQKSWLCFFAGVSKILSLIQQWEQLYNLHEMCQWDEVREG